MGGITSSMMGTKNEQEQVTPGWFTAFNDNFEISFEKTSKRQLLEDVQKKISEELPQKPKQIKRLLARFRKSKSKVLISQEDAKEVVNCCFCVLEDIYEISINTPYSIELCHFLKSGSTVEIENIPGFETPGKTRKKWFGPHKNEGTINILSSVPYILAVKDLLELCFAAKIENIKASKGSDDSRNSKDADGQENVVRTEEGESKGEIKKQKVPEEEKWEKKEQHLIAWLVANCLYIMGELEYAEQYIADYQKDGQNGGFVEACNILGFPWEVQEEKSQLVKLKWEKYMGKESLPLVRKN